MDEDDDYGSSAPAAEEDDAFSSLISQLSAIRTTEPEELVKKWSEIMSVPVDEANFFLSAANYNLEAAISFYMDAHTRERVVPKPPASRAPYHMMGMYRSAFGAAPAAEDAEAAEMDPELQAALAASAAAAAGLPEPPAASAFPPLSGGSAPAVASSGVSAWPSAPSSCAAPAATAFGAPGPAAAFAPAAAAGAAVAQPFGPGGLSPFGFVPPAAPGSSSSSAGDAMQEL
jgi:hypothetical protein